MSLGSARAGNVIGGGDWSEDRLIPDSLMAFQSDRSVRIRNPLATRPWQHVLEPICGYLTLAERLFCDGDMFASGWNFGPDDCDSRPVGAVIDYLVENWPQNVSWQLDGKEQPHEAQALKLDISKAKTRLNWFPQWRLNYALDRIIEWHQAWLVGDDMRGICLKQIYDYEFLLKQSRNCD